MGEDESFSGTCPTCGQRCLFSYVKDRGDERKRAEAAEAEVGRLRDLLVGAQANVEMLKERSTPAERNLVETMMNLQNTIDAGDDPSDIIGEALAAVVKERSTGGHNAG